jgi:hypothetical protein
MLFSENKPYTDQTAPPPDQVTLFVMVAYTYSTSDIPPPPNRKELKTHLNLTTDYLLFTVMTLFIFLNNYFKN